MLIITAIVDYLINNLLPETTIFVPPWSIILMISISKILQNYNYVYDSELICNREIFSNYYALILGLLNAAHLLSTTAKK